MNDLLSPPSTYSVPLFLATHAPMSHQFTHLPPTIQEPFQKPQLNHTHPYLSWSESVSLSHAQFFVTPCTVAHQAPLSMEFFRQEYWSGVAIAFYRGSSWPRIEPGSPALQADSSLSEPLFKNLSWMVFTHISHSLHLTQCKHRCIYSAKLPFVLILVMRW